MNSKKIFTLIGLGAVITAVSYFRRHILGKLLKLPPVQHTFIVTKRVRIPMPDGITLVADHYTSLPPRSSLLSPHSSPLPLPTILIRTPYGRSNINTLFASCFAERGYHVVIQDVRGRFDSEGIFEPRVHEADDGLATLNWITEQPWSNGQVGMWGQSYVGYVQWAVAHRNPPALKAIVPSITAAQVSSFFYSQGAFSLEFVLRWMVQIDGMDGLSDLLRGKWAAWERTHHVTPNGQDVVLEPLWNQLPLATLDKLALGRTADFYQNYLVHPPDDPYWQTMDYHEHLPQVAAPAHLVSGWYDFLLWGLLRDYETLQVAGKRPFLTIGPWHHFSGENMLTSLREGLEWFDEHLKSEKYPVSSTQYPVKRWKAVKLFVMGAEQWREFDAWPPPAQETHYFLQENGRLSLSSLLTPHSSSHYTYNPADPTPSLGGALFNALTAGPQDNRPLEARPDVLTFTTPPLPADVTVIGPVRLQLFVQSSTPTADFFGRLCDVQPDGRSLNVCDGLFRLLPGQNQPDGTVQIEVDMWATAYCFRQGHAIRLQVSSGAHPRWARNLGTTEPLGSATQMVTAEQTIWHDEKRPSALILPVV